MTSTIHINLFLEAHNTKFSERPNEFYTYGSPQCSRISCCSVAIFQDLMVLCKSGL